MTETAWVLTALRAINSGVSLDDLLRQLAEAMGDHWPVRRASVYRYSPAGDLTVQGIYGANPVVIEPYRSVAVTDHAPVPDCARRGELLVFADRDALKSQYENWSLWPFLPESLVCLPLLRAGIVMGVLWLEFKTPLSELKPPFNPEAEEFLWLSEICQAAIMRNGHNNGFGHNNGNHNGNHNGNGSDLAGGKLSDRHLELLRLVCAGDTNRQIAKTLHLAESTVRYELSRLYSRLGVETRQQAAALAHIYLDEQPATARA